MAFELKLLDPVGGAARAGAINSGTPVAANVTNNGDDIARFTHVALDKPLQVGDPVDLSGFTVSYPGTQIVTVASALFFETALAYVADEAGFFERTSLNAKAYWTYGTKDPLATITTAGYFNEARDLVNTGDAIIIGGQGNSFRWTAFLVVPKSPLATNVTLSAGFLDATP